MAVAADLAAAVQTTGLLVGSAFARLCAAGIETARLDAEVLLAEAARVDRATLYAGWRRAVPVGCHMRFEALLTRRLAREPLQYIVGRQEFWSLDFAVSPAVLIPRPETELLVELTLRALSANSRSPHLLGSMPDHYSSGRGTSPPYASVDVLGNRASTGSARAGRRSISKRNSAHPELVEGCLSLSHRAAAGSRNGGGLRLCDLGTGSGCIAVTLARELPHATVWAFDIAAAALAVAATNARRHDVADRVRPVCSDLFAAAGDLCFDAIISNPPYIRSDALRRLQPELGWEPTAALDGGASGLDIIERVVTQSYGRLQHGGWLIVEIGADQRSAADQLAHAAGFRSVSVAPDYAGIPRALVARKA